MSANGQQRTYTATSLRGFTNHVGNKLGRLDSPFLALQNFRFEPNVTLRAEQPHQMRLPGRFYERRVRSLRQLILLHPEGKRTCPETV